jgi:hypothetical protein
MPRLSALTGILVLMAFLSGMGFGLYFGGSFASSPVISVAASKVLPAVSPDVTPAEREAADTLAKIHAQDAEQQVEAEKRNRDAMILADRLAFYKKYPDRMAPQAFGEDLKVTDIMADFLKMTDAERKSVSAHLAQIGSATKQYEQANLKLVKQDGDSVTYEIAPYPQGKELRDQLTNMIEGDIGADRADLFLGSSKWEFNESFSGFGEKKTQISIKRTDSSGAPSYMLSETFGDGSGMSRSIGNTLPSRFAGLLQLDPSP